MPFDSHGSKKVETGNMQGFTIQYKGTSDGRMDGMTDGQGSIYRSNLLSRWVQSEVNNNCTKLHITSRGFFLFIWNVIKNKTTANVRGFKVGSLSEENTHLINLVDNHSSDRTHSLIKKGPLIEASLHMIYKISDILYTKFTRIYEEN